MAGQGMQSLAGWVDLASKLVVTLVVPFATFVLKEQVDRQTRAVESQTRSFDQALRTGQRDLDMTLKFYDVIGSKRFECFEDSDAGLLNIFVEQNNRFNAIPINGADVIDALLRQTLRNPNCPAFQDARSVVASTGRVPVANSAPAATGTDDNRAIRAAGASVARSRSLPPVPAPAPAPPAASPAPAGVEPGGGSGLPGGAVGWAALGRYNGLERGFANFTVLSGDLGKVDDRGSVAAGAILRARWAVYLRLNTTDTLQRGNPILGVLSEGTCVAVKSSVPDLRGQTWAAITLQPSCPTGDYK